MQLGRSPSASPLEQYVRVPSELDRILSVATPDIGLAVAWLLSEGAVVTARDDPHGMAFALAKFAVGDAEVRMVRDRGVWSMDLRLAGQRHWLQFDLMHRILTDEVPTDRPGRRLGDLPPQTPEGVSWRDCLPTALGWLCETADAVGQVKAMARTRSRELFPPT